MAAHYQQNDVDELELARNIRRRIAIIPVVIAIVALLAGTITWTFLDWSPSAGSVVIGVCGAILIFDVPVCIWVIVDWMRTGEPPALHLSPLIPCREERELHRRLRQRPKLDDEAFYQTFFADQDVPIHVPIRLRKIVEDATGVDMGGIHPDDNLLWVDTELDFADVLKRIESEFEVRIAADQIGFDDCQFGALAMQIAARLPAKT